MTPHISIKLLLTQSDERLVRMTASGHDRAFEAIVDRYRRQLLRYAERFPGAGPAEDVVQAAFVRAWGALRDGTEVRDLRPWLYRIVHNTALNAVKREHGTDAELVESEALGVGPEAESEIQEDLRRTLGGIAALPGRQRDALLAVAVDGRAHADVGRELGLTEPAVRQLVRRARANVRSLASALTPYPLVAWASELGAQATTAARIGEIVGGAGAGAAALKLGAAVAATGALVAGAPAVHQAVRSTDPAPATAQAAETGAGTQAGTTRRVASGGTTTSSESNGGSAGAQDRSAEHRGSSSGDEGGSSGSSRGRDAGDSGDAGDAGEREHHTTSSSGKDDEGASHKRSGESERTSSSSEEGSDDHAESAGSTSSSEDSRSSGSGTAAETESHSGSSSGEDTKPEVQTPEPQEPEAPEHPETLTTTAP